MTYQEKLLQFIMNLTDEEADAIVSRLKDLSSSSLTPLEPASLVHPCSSLQSQ